MFPCDAITIPFIVPSNSNLLLLATATDSYRTILATNIQNSGLNSAGQAQTIKADGLYLNFVGSENFINAPSYYSYKTQAEIRAYNTSPTYGAIGQVVYVDRDLSSTTTIPACQSFNQDANTGADILTAYFIFILICGLCFGFIFKNYIRQK